MEPDGVRRTLCLALLLLGLWQLGAATWIDAKALLAQRLIAGAWQRTLDAGGVPVKPWPWADTWPVARLQVPRHGQDLFVLAGAHGQSLAFGPGHESASAPLGEAGLSVIGGHRDTHFDFLETLRPHTLLSLQLPDGRQQSYRVTDAKVVDVRVDPVPAGSARSELLLVTCYPFDAVMPGGPLRWVVRAAAMSTTAPTHELHLDAVVHGLRDDPGELFQRR
jgi:sortase A